MSLGIDHNTNFEDKNEICSKYNGSLLKMKKNNVPLYYYCQMPNCNDITSDNLNSYTDINDSLVNFKKPMCDVDPNDYRRDVNIIRVQLRVIPSYSPVVLRI